MLPRNVLSLCDVAHLTRLQIAKTNSVFSACQEGHKNYAYSRHALPVCTSNLLVAITLASFFVFPQLFSYREVFL